MLKKEASADDVLDSGGCTLVHPTLSLFHRNESFCFRLLVGEKPTKGSRFELFRPTMIEL